MKELILLLAKCCGMFRLSRWITRRDLRILAYHGIWIGSGHFGNYLYMSADKFSRRMRQLKALNMPVLPLGEALSRMDSGTLPDQAVVLTIDDGWYSTYLHMLPELEAQHFPATLYLTTYYAENPYPVFEVLIEYMFSQTAERSIDPAKLGVGVGAGMAISDAGDRDRAKLMVKTYASEMDDERSRQAFARKLGRELGVDYEYLLENRVFNLVSLGQAADMFRRGLDIQLHTHRHRVSHRGDECLARELDDNRASLDKVITGRREHFCYPSGIYDVSLWPVLSSAGIVSATTTDVGLVRQDTPRYALPRILDGEQVSDIEFEAELSGLLELKRRILRVFRNGRVN